MCLGTLEKGEGKIMKRKLGRGKERGLLRRDESGQVLVIVALAAVVLIGMVALAVDLSHGLVVRHELQSAADASALAGAVSLFTPTPGPNWARAEGAASSFITQNKSDGQSLSNCQVQSGVWNRSQSPAGLQSNGIPLDAQNVAAVRVQVGRAPGQNGGSVPTFFARIFGFNSFPVQANAVAVVSPIGSALPGPLLPVAISRELADRYKNYKDPAHTFLIGSPYHYPNSLAGQWTSLLIDSNNVPTIRDLIQNGNPTQINVGDQIWIQPGTKTSLYASVNSMAGQDVLLSVVDIVIQDTTHARATVVGFVGFHIVRATGGSSKTIEGYFVDGFTAPNSGGSGPIYYGALTPPTLVQ